MIIFTCLFLVRVAAQLIELIIPGASPAAFDRWHSSTIEYGFLLPLQVSILMAMFYGIRSLPRISLNRRLVTVLKTFSILYFMFMLVRLATALFGFIPLAWFQLPLPALFHLALAGYLFCFAYSLDSRRHQLCTR